MQRAALLLMEENRRPSADTLCLIVFERPVSDVHFFFLKNIVESGYVGEEVNKTRYLIIFTASLAAPMAGGPSGSVAKPKFFNFVFFFIIKKFCCNKFWFKFKYLVF